MRHLDERRFSPSGGLEAFFEQDRAFDCASFKVICELVSSREEMRCARKAKKGRNHEARSSSSGGSGSRREWEGACGGGCGGEMSGVGERRKGGHRRERSSTRKCVG